MKCDTCSEVIFDCKICTNDKVCIECKSNYLAYN